jgi:hypothetical protein
VHNTTGTSGIWFWWTTWRYVLLLLMGLPEGSARRVLSAKKVVRSLGKKKESRLPRPMTLGSSSKKVAS